MVFTIWTSQQQGGEGVDIIIKIDIKEIADLITMLKSQREVKFDLDKISHLVQVSLQEQVSEASDL